MGFQGEEISIPIGVAGFSGNENPKRLTASSMTVARNISFDNDTARKIPGYFAFDSTAISGTPTLYGAIDWHPISGTHRIISAWSNGSIYRENGGDVDAATVTSGLSLTAPVIMVPCGRETAADDRKLAIFSKGIEPKYIAADASTLTSMTLSADWTGATNYPVGAILHDNRLAAWNHLYHNIYHSTLADHHDFSTGSPPIVEVFPGEGEYIACAFSMIGTRIYVFKYPFGIYWYDTDGIASATYIPVSRLRDDVGMAGPRGIARVGQDIWFISSRGHIHSLTAAENAEELSASDITSRLKMAAWVRDNVDLTKLEFAQLLYDDARKEVCVTYTSKETNTNSLRLLIDVSMPDEPRLAIDDRAEVFQTMFYYRENDYTQQLFGGGEGGLIHRFNRVTRSANGSAYTSEFKLADTDFDFHDPRIAQKEKRFFWLKLSILPTGNYNATLQLFIDDQLYDTYSINLGNEGAVFGTAVFGTDTFGGSTLIDHQIPIGGIGKRMAIKLFNSGLNQDFSISEAVVYLKVLGSTGES